MARILIVGGGIGGLVTALRLHADGHDVTVREQVAEVRPLGVGINLLPHAVAVLAGLGLEDDLAAIAIETAELAYFNRHGQEIWREPRGRAAGYPVPQFSIHRGELQMLLHRAASAELGHDGVVTGRKLLGFEDIGSGRMRAMFADRESSGIETIEADLMIAADGIHSSVRAILYPQEGPPKWNGAVLWRGVTDDCAPFLSGRSMIMAGHQDQKFVCYPISRQAHEQGRARLNWIAERRFDTAQPWRREDWNRAGRLDEIVPAFEDWRFGWLDVPAVMRAASGVWEFPMVDRDPLPRWSFGALTLLGDAAHPMYPIGSNGASQAILDAEALSRAIREHGPTPHALGVYEAERLPKTAAIVLANRGNGPEQVMQMAEERAPQGFARIEDVIARADLEAIAARYKQVAGFDPASVARLAGRRA
jgi:2-polyprenyl-6-methoxyphenol hydroxylase-like FAD-dependent oxidoreductase